MAVIVTNAFSNAAPRFVERETLLRRAGRYLAALADRPAAPASPFAGQEAVTRLEMQLRGRLD